MTPTATPQTIVISPDHCHSKLLVTIPSSTKTTTVGMAASHSPCLPKYAVGLFDSNGQGPRKRKRLTHLTPEEKIMRRKLKNRVAAQTARDRKKVRMECLEETISKVQKQAQELLNVNMQLLERAEALERENAELRVRLGLSSQTSFETVSDKRDTVERIKIEFDEVSGSMEEDSYINYLPESILSPDESSDENDNHVNRKRQSLDSTCAEAPKKCCLATNECASSEPAAGSCQAYADPLEGSRGNTETDASRTETSSGKDILRLLEQIDTPFDPESFLDLDALTGERCTGSARGADPASNARVTAQQLDSIKELINIDHIYSKPVEETVPPHPDVESRKPTIKVQLSRSTRLTKLIKQLSPSSQVQRRKPAALCEKTARKNAIPAAESVLQKAVEQSQNANAVTSHRPPMLSATKQEPDPPVVDDLSEPGVLDLDNLDEELDFILNANSACQASLQLPQVPLESELPPTPESSASEASTESFVVETPTTLPDVSDLFPSFDDGLDYGSCLNDAVSTELFPQLASFMA